MKNFAIVCLALGLFSNSFDAHASVTRHRLCKGYYKVSFYAKKRGQRLDAGPFRININSNYLQIEVRGKAKKRGGKSIVPGCTNNYIRDVAKSQAASSTIRCLELSLSQPRGVSRDCLNRRRCGASGYFSSSTQCVSRLRTRRNSFCRIKYYAAMEKTIRFPQGKVAAKQVMKDYVCPVAKSLVRARRGEAVIVSGFGATAVANCPTRRQYRTKRLSSNYIPRSLKTFVCP